MARIAVNEPAGIAVVHSQKQRRVFFKWRAVIQLMVQQRQHGPRRDLGALHHRFVFRGDHLPRNNSLRLTKNRDPFDRIRPHRRVDRRHKQRVRNSLPAHITDRQNQAIGTDGKEIVIIATHAAGGPAETVHLQVRELRHLFREKLVLDFLRDRDFVLQPLLLFLLDDKLLDGLGHQVKGTGQRRQLVIRRDWNSMAEVAAINEGGGAVEFRDAAGNRARQLAADVTGDHLKYSENYGNDKKQNF